jgi:Membrane domain of glycerophosphoryl diester phosphodiesterase
MGEPTLYPPPRPLTVGEVLDLSFRIYRRTFVKCLLFGALLVVSRSLPNIYSIARGQSLTQTMVRPNVDTAHVILLLIGLLLAFLFPIAITLRQYRMITGEAPGGELLRVLRWLGRIILILILMMLIGVACALLAVPASLAGGGVLRWVLFAVLLLPAGYVVLRLESVFTVMVIEDTGPMDSLARSWELTGGNVLRLMAINTVALFLLFALYVVVGSLTAFMYAAFGRGDVALIAAAIGVVTVAAGAVATPYYSSVALAVYGDLRVRKEGADLSQRISAT